MIHGSIHSNDAASFKPGAVQNIGKDVEVLRVKQRCQNLH
jgi:hypothetical protein